jgi:hypothetical protein
MASFSGQIVSAIFFSPSYLSVVRFLGLFRISVGQNKGFTVKEERENPIGPRMYSDSAFPYFFSPAEFLKILRRDSVEFFDQPQNPQYLLGVFGFQ